MHRWIVVASIVTGSLQMNALAGDVAPAPFDRAVDRERLSFQTSGPWSPRVDLNADVALVYGIGSSLPSRIEDWKSHGYRIHVMTGVAWGDYQDYVHGQWNGTKHEDEEQMLSDGSPKAHGRDVYYMSPGPDYGKYLSEGVKSALDAGALAVCLEEPEFWVDSGWEPNFKRQWQAIYHEDWRAPDCRPTPSTARRSSSISSTGKRSGRSSISSTSTPGHTGARSPATWRRIR